jgi:hypothetical protein
MKDMPKMNAMQRMVLNAVIDAARKRGMDEVRVKINGELYTVHLNHDFTWEDAPQWLKNNLVTIGK